MDKQLEIRKAINGLSLQEAQQLLTIIKLQLDMVEAKGEKVDLYTNLRELYEQLLVPHPRVSIWEPDEATEQVHIVFGDSPAGSLKIAIKQLGLADTNKIIVFREQFSIGPLWQLHEEAGKAYRAEWFRDHISIEVDVDDYDFVYDQKITEQINCIPAEATIVVWSGNNAHDQAGLRYALYLLRDKPNRVVLFNAAAACEATFNTADRYINYLHAGEISPEKLQAVFREIDDIEAITFETRQLLEHEWLTLANHRDVLRIWDGERIQNVDEHYYDAYLLETVDKLHASWQNRDFIKAARVIGEALGYCDQYVGDLYFEYRLRELIYSGALAIKGVPRAMRYYSVRRK